MPRTVRKNIVKISPEVLVVECELDEKGVVISQSTINVNKNKQWNLLEEIKTGEFRGIVQIKRFKHKVFKYDGKYYIIIEHANPDKIPDGQKIRFLLEKTHPDHSLRKKHNHKRKSDLLIGQSDQNSKEQNEHQEQQEQNEHQEQQEQNEHQEHQEQNEYQEQQEQDEFNTNNQKEIQETNPNKYRVSFSPLTYGDILPPQIDSVLVDDVPFDDFVLV